VPVLFLHCILDYCERIDPDVGDEHGGVVDKETNGRTLREEEGLSLPCHYFDEAKTNPIHHMSFEILIEMTMLLPVSCYRLV
jgi:hypothetical protein